MPTLGTLAAGLDNLSAVRRSEVFITELDEDDRPITGEGGLTGAAPIQYRRFQYFPDSIADTKAVNYQTKEVPGGSLPLYQYINSGERQITFTAMLTTDVDHLANIQLTDFDAEVRGGSFGDQLGQQPDVVSRRLLTERAILAAQERLRAAGAQARNPYIPAALAWLRRFTLPRYGNDSEVGVPLTKPPRKLFLHFTGTNIEVNGGMGAHSIPGGGILCIMTQCDINYESFFPSGNPRIATVSLGFAEVPQRAGSVRFPSAEGMDRLSNLYTLVAATAPSSGGGEG